MQEKVKITQCYVGSWRQGNLGRRMKMIRERRGQRPREGDERRREEWKGEEGRREKRIGEERR